MSTLISTIKFDLKFKTPNQFVTSKKWNYESTNPVFTCFSNVFLEVFPDIFLVFAALKVEKTVFIDSLQGCRKRGAGGAPIFGRSVNPISTRGGADYAHHITTCPPHSLIFRPCDGPALFRFLISQMRYSLIVPSNSKLPLLLIEF